MPWLANIFSFIANSKAAQIVLAVLGAILAFKTVQMTARMDGEKAQKQKHKIQRAEEQVRVSETRRVIEQETQDARHRADEAVSNLPQYSSADELRTRDPGLAAIVFGPARGSDGPTETR